jgi:hypothetical protein
MSSSQRLLVLANSVKKGGRCVAGRVVEREFPLRLGQWIRPVSAEAEGTLNPRRHLGTACGRPLQVLDDVEVPLSEAKPGTGQPENWLLVPNATWTRLGHVPEQRPLTAQLREEPDSIWFDRAADHSDRVRPGAPVLGQLERSLVIIEPEGLEFRLERRHQPKYGKNHQPRAMACFGYRDHRYELPITDDRYTHDNFEGEYPAEDGPDHARVLPAPDPMLLCVSLTEPYKGHHYKVVATILRAG